MNAYRVLVGNPEGKRPLGRTIRRWENNIKMNLREIGWYGMNHSFVYFNLCVDTHFDDPQLISQYSVVLFPRPFCCLYVRTLILSIS
jgi:hypothetical protein